MVYRLDTDENNFEQNFAKLIQKQQQTEAKVQQVVAAILEQVKQQGDEALFELTQKFDNLALSSKNLRIDEKEINQGFEQTPREVVLALEMAHERIFSHHLQQKPQNSSYTDDFGVTLGTRWTPIDTVGVYVPGGLASYPSSVLMNAVPARVAGVERVAMVVPTPNGQINPAVLAAAKIAGINEIYRIGGAQAIAALAYGTDLIKPVFKIVGPGNAYVAEAKRQVFGRVGIDMIAGPSEVLIIADETANISWIATDLLAQAEHGSGARAIAIVPTKIMGDELQREVLRQLKTMQRGDIAAKGWNDLGAIIVSSSADRSVELANIMAPEHLELALDKPDDLVAKIKNAGAIFLGHHTPEAVGDYVGGSNHVLPTAQTARFTSGLGTMDFMKRTSLLHCTPAALGAVGPATVTLANCENLEAHGRSVSIRLNR